MIAVVQRVESCSVWIENLKKSSIAKGILILLGVEKYDSIDDIKYLTNKIIKLRIFNDSNNKMNLSVKDIEGGIMVVSQFTLCADVNKGNRPSYINAMQPKEAEKLYNQFINYIKKDYVNVKQGLFKSNMNIDLINQGPVTIITRSNHATN